MKWSMYMCFLLFCLGCSTTPDDPQFQSMFEIEDSDAHNLTKSQVVEMYGQPDSIKKIGGEEEWFFDKAADESKLILVFDNEGNLVSTRHNSEE